MVKILIQKYSGALYKNTRLHALYAERLNICTLCRLPIITARANFRSFNILHINNFSRQKFFINTSKVKTIICSEHESKYFMCKIILFRFSLIVAYLRHVHHYVALRVLHLWCDVTARQNNRYVTKKPEATLEEARFLRDKSTHHRSVYILAHRQKEFRVRWNLSFRLEVSFLQQHAKNRRNQKWFK